MLFVVLILVMGMGRALMDAEFHPFDPLTLLPLKMHVEIADLELRKFPFESGGAHSEIGECADRHVAADPRDAIEIKDFHRLMDASSCMVSVWS